MADTDERSYQNLVEAMKNLSNSNQLAADIVLDVYQKTGNRRLIPLMQNLADALVSIDQAHQQAEGFIPKIVGFLPGPTEESEEEKQKAKISVPYLTLLDEDD